MASRCPEYKADLFTLIENLIFKVDAKHKVDGRIEEGYKPLVYVSESKEHHG